MNQEKERRKDDSNSIDLPLLMKIPNPSRAKCGESLNPLMSSNSKFLNMMIGP